MSLLRNLVFVHDIEEIAAPGHEMAIECCVDPGFNTRWFRPEVRWIVTGSRTRPATRIGSDHAMQFTLAPCRRAPGRLPHCLFRVEVGLSVTAHPRPYGLRLTVFSRQLSRWR